MLIHGRIRHDRIYSRRDGEGHGEQCEKIRGALASGDRQLKKRDGPGTAVPQGGGAKLQKQQEAGGAAAKPKRRSEAGRLQQSGAADARKDCDDSGAAKESTPQKRAAPQGKDPPPDCFRILSGYPDCRDRISFL